MFQQIVLHVMRPTTIQPPTQITWQQGLTMFAWSAIPQRPGGSRHNLQHMTLSSSPFIQESTLTSGTVVLNATAILPITRCFHAWIVMSTARPEWMIHIQTRMDMNITAWHASTATPGAPKNRIYVEIFFTHINSDLSGFRFIWPGAK